MGPGINSVLSKDFLHLSPDPMAVLDNNGHLRKTNPAFGRITGMTARRCSLNRPAGSCRTGKGNG
ncbi:MAG: PAS domain S-box protein [Spirochaetales bacterium]|nr:PAS domain S-box protein [Spirochaetales bacterium]